MLPRLLARRPDTTVSVWLFARPTASLDSVRARVAAAGENARVRVVSRWLHAVSADVPATALRQLLENRDLRRIQPLGRFKLQPPRPGRSVVELAPSVAPGPAQGPGDTCGFTPGDDPVLGPSAMPYRQLHLRPLTDQGIDATGVRVGIFDTGFDTANPAFSGITITAQHDFVFNDSVVKDEPGKDVSGAQFHGTATWSLFAGDVPGGLHGIARGASFLLAKTEDIRTETRVEEDNYVAALEWADSIGVDIVSTSLAYLSFDNGFSYTPSQLNGDVAVTTVAADMAAQRGILVVTAAGNSGPGPRSIWTPADGDSVLAVGAEDSLGTIAIFSSRGPTADGRIKPDFTAPGVAVCVVTGTGQVRRKDGTSFATPLLAASAALVKQLHPSLLPMELRTAFRGTATKRAAPDSSYGWGRPDVAAAAVFPTGLTATSPLPAAGPLTTITPTFSWTVGTVPPSATPVTYRLRISRDSTLAAPIADTALTVETFADRVERCDWTGRRTGLGDADVTQQSRRHGDRHRPADADVEAGAGIVAARAPRVRLGRAARGLGCHGFQCRKSDGYELCAHAAARAQHRVSVVPDSARGARYEHRPKPGIVPRRRSRYADVDPPLPELSEPLPRRRPGLDLPVV